MRRRLFCFLLVASCGALPGASSVRGSVLVGPSSLLTQSDVDQMATWLGEGSIAVTRIFAKQPGDDSYDFHAAVDGQGRTFTVIEVLANSAYNYATGLNDNARQIIGGYNPQSWESIYDYHYSSADADRTAFLFNITTNAVQHQNLIGEGYGGYAGNYQTYNAPYQGPTFGGGHDLYVSTDLTYGYTHNWSYGGASYTDDILSDSGYYHYGSLFGAIEVFTIAAAPDGSVAPEPFSAMVWGGLGIGAALIVHRSTRRRDAFGAF